MRITVMRVLGGCGEAVGCEHIVAFFLLLNGQRSELLARLSKVGVLHELPGQVTKSQRELTDIKSERKKEGQQHHQEQERNCRLRDFKLLESI